MTVESSLLLRRPTEADEEQVLAYRQSFLLVKGLIEKYGRESYLDFLHSLGDGTDFEDALADVFDMHAVTDIKSCMDIRR